MKRRFFALLIVLMTTSLAGIICLQGYLISDTYHRNEIYFNQNANRSLFKTSESLLNREFVSLFNIMQNSVKNLNKNEQILQGFCGQNIDEATFGRDELHLRIRKALDSVSNSVASDTIVNSNIFNYHNAHNLYAVADYEYSFYQSLIRQYTSQLSIDKRLNAHQIKYYLDHELRKNKIYNSYEFAVLNNGIQTNIITPKFKKNIGNSTVFKTSLFDTNNTKDNYELVVNFTGKRSFVLESISLMIILSVVLSLIIMSTFFYAYKLLKSQRNISEIKTDFINNMTHELKTPIATINLALDFIRNPKVINDAGMRETYLNMIGQENQRIHAQVENVLRISKLENKEIDMPKSREDLHVLLKDSVSEIQDQITQYGGNIDFKFSATKHHILANDKYFKTVIKNIIDNSLKYCKKTPKINIITENIKNCIILSIKDNGVGIHKKDKKNIFENFFRESTGNLHNVKGHGLGLAFVKQILDDHQGEIIIDSTKGEGTLVIVKLPLIS